MSQREVSDELIRQVEAKTGESDLEQGVWRLLHRSRGRYVQEEATDGASRLSD